jgi:hypothetical protein
MKYMEQKKCSLWCLFTFWVPCCDVRFDFRMKTMFGSFLPPIVFLRYLCLFTYWGVQHILCCFFSFVLCTVPYVVSFSGLSILYCPFGIQGRIQNFKLGGRIKKIAPSGGSRENFGVFRVKNHDFTPKNHIFSHFRGGARRVPPPPLDPPLVFSNTYLLQK